MSASDVPKSTQKLVQPVVAAGLSMIRLEIPPDHPHRKRFPCVFLSFFFCLLFFGGFFVRFETPGQRSQLELFLLKNKQQKKKETPLNPTSKGCASMESGCPSVALSMELAEKGRCRESVSPPQTHQGVIPLRKFYSEVNPDAALCLSYVN